jgi:repressor LexA
MPNELTGIERRILGLICTALAETGWPPPVRQLATAAGLRSVESLHWYLDRLQEKGMIRRDPRRMRAIEVDCQGLDLGRTSADNEPVETAAPEPARTSPPVPASAPEDGSAQRPELLADQSADDPASPATQPDHAAPAISRTDQHPEPYPEAATTDVPLLGRVAAGRPIPPLDEVEAIYRLPVDLVGHGEGLFMLRIDGESMNDAGILDGDLVVVRPQQQANNGDIVAALVDGEATVKRLYLHADRLELRPDNPFFDSIETTDALVIGKAVAVVRRIR